MSSKTLRRKGNGTFGGQNAGKSFKIKGKQLPSTSVQRLFSAVYRPDTLNSSKSSGGDTVRVRPPLPAPRNPLIFKGFRHFYLCFSAGFIFRLFVNSWGKEIKQNQQSKQLQSSGCLIFKKFLMGENM
ncbi:MAG: hypothetical protein IJU56_03535 [Clostridia bacterium]|nr:hypothetical protein [Clostridia bacterium]